MPIYEYHCDECEAVAEYIHGVSQDGPTVCKACGQESKLTKRMSRPSTLGRKISTEEEAVAYASTLETAKGFGIIRPDNYIKDDHGHYVEADPDDPAVKEFHRKRHEDRVEGEKKSHEALDEAYKANAKGENPFAKKDKKKDKQKKSS